MANTYSVNAIVKIIVLKHLITCLLALALQCPDAVAKKASATYTRLTKR
jgi:hypothetical protein